LLPFKDEVIDVQDFAPKESEPVLVDHVAPESVELYIYPPETTAVSFVPSRDDATAFHARLESLSLQDVLMIEFVNVMLFRPTSPFVFVTFKDKVVVPRFEGCIISEPFKAQFTVLVDTQLSYEYLQELILRELFGFQLTTGAQDTTV
jgi:hypothetical protein